MGNQVDLKVCPLWAFLALTVASIKIDYSELPIPENDNRNYWSSMANCKGECCQLWDIQRGDCGLKHPSPSQDQNTIPEDENVETSCPATIPEKNWDEQKENQPDFHPIDCPPQFPKEVE
jgi:hypothetical protein